MRQVKKYEIAEGYKKADGSAEQKIKEAARALFTKKGYAAVKTRDIAAEAGINLALLNYYFRSKEKLFKIIMLESLQQFINGILLLLSGENKSLDEKIETLVSGYIDLLIQNPNLPLFVLSELKDNPGELPLKLSPEILNMRLVFMKQIEEAMKKGKIPSMHPLHFMSNLMGLIIFPFIGRPMLENLGKIEHKQFITLMEERKKMIPVWIKAMMMAKP